MQQKGINGQKKQLTIPQPHPLSLSPPPKLHQALFLSPPRLCLVRVMRATSTTHHSQLYTRTKAYGAGELPETMFLSSP